jgi:type IV pilus assembly protein PilO
MKLDLQPLFQKVEKLSKLHRILICVGTLILLVGPSVYFLFMPKHKEISQLEGQLSKLEQELMIAKRKAAKLKEVEAQMAAAREKFEEAKKALPESEEIPTLLTNISHSGQDAGLDFLLFQPKSEKPKGFYAEIPVSIRVNAGYHDFVKFTHKISELNRIVNVKDIRMTKASKKAENDLQVTCTAVTYKFLESTPQKKK